MCYGLGASEVFRRVPSREPSFRGQASGIRRRLAASRAKWSEGPRKSLTRSQNTLVKA